MAAVDAQMIEQRDMVRGEAVPAVLRRDWRPRPAAGIALIHRDDAEPVGKFGCRVDRCGRLAPHLDDRGQPGRGEGQDRKSLPVFLVIEAGSVVFKTRHVGSLLKTSVAAGLEIGPISKSARLEIDW